MSHVTDTTFYVHPTALCESAHVGEGTRIWAFAHVLDGAVVGKHCTIGDHSFIEGGARIGDCVTIKNQAMIWEGVTIQDDAFIGPGVVFTNDRYPRSRRMAEARARYETTDTWLVRTVVARGASIGAGAVLLGGIRVGRFASIGASALVTQDVPDHCVVVGQPARAAGWACCCGVTLSTALSCPNCHRQFQLREGTHLAAG